VSKSRHQLARQHPRLVSFARAHSRGKIEHMFVQKTFAHVVVCTHSIQSKQLQQGTLSAH
jgi:hypothetical protein